MNKRESLALVCTGYPIPTETFILAQVIMLQNMGYSVDVFPYRRWPDLPGDFKKNSLHRNIYPAIIPPANFFLRTWKCIGFTWKYRWFIFRLFKTLNPFLLGKDALNLTVFYSALPFLNKPAYKTIIANFGENGVGVEKLIRCGFLRTRLIVWFHGYDMSSHSVLQQMEKGYQKLFLHCTYAIGVSRMMCNKMLSLGCPDHKLIYLPYSPRSDFFLIKPEIKQDRFLAVGRFVEKKAPLLTIKAFAMAKTRMPNASLIMVGDGPLLQTCKEYVVNQNIENVYFKGRLSHEETLHCFENAFCFVQHSVVATNGDSEGTPVGILEAGAAGLPVISTLHAGIPDVVIHQQTGLLVKEKDVEAMGKAMVKLFTDRTLAGIMGQRAKQHINENFGQMAFENQLKKLLES